jgi:hypothetical protein
MNNSEQMVYDLRKIAKRMRRESASEARKRITKNYGRIGGALGALAGFGYGLHRAGLRSAARKRGLPFFMGLAGGATGMYLGRKLGDVATAADYGSLDPRRHEVRETRYHRLKEWLKYGPNR